MLTIQLRLVNDAFREMTPESPTIEEKLGGLLVFNILRTAKMLDPLVNEGLRMDGVTSSQINVLQLLENSAETGLMMSEIGRNLVVTKANITGLIDRMEKKGWVQRQSSDDRREVRVQLTEEGCDLLRRVIPSHARHVTDLTAIVDGKDKETLIRVLSELRRELRKRRKGGGC